MRSAVNVDVTPGGSFQARAGYEKVYTGAAVRGVKALGEKLLVADGTSLVEFDTTTGTSRVLRTIAGSGVFCGDVLNDVLYFCTENEALEYDGSTVRRWGVADVLDQPPISLVAGTLPAGAYQVAMTYTDQYGREGGTDMAATIAVDGAQALSLSITGIPAEHTANVYVSAVNGSSLYLQHTTESDGVVVIGSVRDDTAVCQTMLLRSPEPGSQVVAHNGVLATAAGCVVAVTQPLRPHLWSRRTGFFQFPAAVGEMVSSGGLFVSADKCYMLKNVELADPTQSVVLDVPAIKGTATKSRDGVAAWMTPYGQALLDDSGAKLLHKSMYAVLSADEGAAGVLEYSGNQLVVTSLRGVHDDNPLAAADFFIAEVIIP